MPVLENGTYRLEFDPASAAPVSILIKGLSGCDILTEKRLAANFRICLPLSDCLSNYIEGMQQQPVSADISGGVFRASFSELSSPNGVYPIDLEYSVGLEGDLIRFRARITNNCPHPIAEFWFPRLGGWTQFGSGREARLAEPGYTDCSHSIPLFREFPGAHAFGAEAAEYTRDYPGMAMPWWDIYDAEQSAGFYLGYHDPVFRFSTWHLYLHPTVSGNPGDSFLHGEQAAGEPAGLTFSHVRYPFIHSGETFDSGEFIIRLHRGDWHEGSMFYRDWFLAHFPLGGPDNWLRKQSAWFTSIIYQPEDRIVASYRGYDEWTREAQESGIKTFELIGWDKGGLERDYPEYVPEKKLGGKRGFHRLLAAIRSRGGRCLVFVNYNILDTAGSLFRRRLKRFKHQDRFGETPNWMSWGESTLVARKNISVRRHILASIVPEFQELLESYFLELVKAGASGFQIDKLCNNATLDFNPLNTRKPDEALCEGLVQAIARLLAKCREIDPEFCLASEASQDRLIPYVRVFYRNAAGASISPLRYVFPEWTACQHVSAPQDRNGVNGAVLTGAVICLEPDMYQAPLSKPLYRDLVCYVQEVERIRSGLRDTIFLGDYLDTTGAEIRDDKPGEDAGSLHYRVHANRHTGMRAIAIANFSACSRVYRWEFLHKEIPEADLYVPFESIRRVARTEPLAVGPFSLHVLLETEMLLTSREPGAADHQRSR